ncbi:MAG: hypothetical protein K1X78_16650 [Verrucomicrobiaceae bacterium]|nr:hypothetical protein [Verrucomicrobiaceae bacterium]
MLQPFYVDPTVPLAHVLLAEALLREEAEKKPEERDASVPQRAAFLRKYGLKLLPPDDATLWSRAATSLAAQQDFPLALQAADTALKLDPNSAEAKKARDAAMEGMKAQ